LCLNINQYAVVRQPAGHARAAGCLNLYSMAVLQHLRQLSFQCKVRAIFDPPPSPLPAGMANNIIKEEKKNKSYLYLILIWNENIQSTAVYFLTR
jgi:hypothetical protein